MTLESRHDTGLLVGYIGHITTLNIEHFDFYTPKEGHLCKEVFCRQVSGLNCLTFHPDYNDLRFGIQRYLPFCDSIRSKTFWMKR